MGNFLSRGDNGMTPRHLSESTDQPENASRAEPIVSEKTVTPRRPLGLAARLQTVTGVLQALAVFIVAVTGVIAAVPPFRNAVSGLFKNQSSASSAAQQTTRVAAGGNRGLTSPSGNQPGACPAPHPVTLFIPRETGSHVSVTFQTNCNLSAARKYVLIEEIPHVGKPEPHPVYFVKAAVPSLQAGQTYPARFVLKEPVHTRAEFYVISVTTGGMEALRQNEVVDHGSLELPSGWRRESATEWHVKGWS
jgi:hypothetical protein